MRDVIVPREYYHLFNRGLKKQRLFLSSRDYARFLFLLIFFQSPVAIPNIIRQVDSFMARGSFDVPKDKVEEIITGRTVELISFSIMPNHFHIIAQELAEGGIARYLMRIEDAYTRYFNIKYESEGYLFAGHYRATHVNGNTQLLYLSTYLHRNPRELKQWRNRESEYPWSSLQDYVASNRWGMLLRPEIILDQFPNVGEYKRFTAESIAKSEKVATRLFNLRG